MLVLLSIALVNGIHIFMCLESRVIWLRRLRGFATSCFWRNLLGKGVEKGVEKNKRGKIINILPLWLVGMTGFEPATPRPPDVYSNRAELHPELHLVVARERLELSTS